jgi:hypothetical protein
VPITITYKFKSPRGPLQEKVDQVTTGSEGRFSDQPNAVIKVAQEGTAQAHWPGETGYLEATSASCGFGP